MTGTRVFYIHVIGFALGALGAHFLPFLIPAWLSALGMAVLVPFMAITVVRPFAWLLFGLLWTLFRADLVLGTEWPTELEGRDVTLVGVIATIPEAGERYLKFDLHVERARFQDRPVVFDGLARIRWYEAPPKAWSGLKAGARWRLRARLKQPHGYYNPGTFDYEAYLYRQGIRATGYVREAQSNALLESAAGKPLQSYRQGLRDGMDALMGNLAHPELLRALALGDRTTISHDAWRTLRNTGTSHLIAISGLHVGLAAAIGVWLGLWAGRIAGLFAAGISAPRVGAVAGAGLALVYAAVSGFDVPAQRALVMASVFLLALFSRRHAWTPRNLCTALVFVLLVNPASVQDPGFWLSFSAVALIMAWTMGRDIAPGLKGRALEAIKLQALLSLALLPLVSAFFGIAPLLAAPANLLAVPLVMLTIVPLCLASVAGLATGWQDVAGLALSSADWLLAGLWLFLSWCGGWEQAIFTPRLDTWRAAVLMAAILWWLWVGDRRRYWSLACLLVLLVPAASVPQSGAFRVVVLDVGQGLSAVVRTKNHTLVYDTGPRYPSGFSLANSVLIPHLRWRSVTAVDTLIISHGDNDHRGGYEDLMSALPVKAVKSSIAHKLPGAAPCRRGQSWQWDGVSFRILHPRRERPPEHNNASCVLRVANRFGSILLTGDIESQAEAALLRHDKAALRSDILLVPHQGSATSSLPSFIDAVEPRWAIVAAGYRNHYGHPHPEVMARYHRRGIETRNTASAGAVIARVSREGIEVRGWREARPGFWLNRDDAGQGDESI